MTSAAGGGREVYIAALAEPGTREGFFFFLFLFLSRSLSFSNVLLHGLVDSRRKEVHSLFPGLLV